MWLLALMLSLPAPSDATLVYYNARMALREGKPTEALKLWLLRNSIESEKRQLGVDDEDFKSVLWTATAALGLCPDGLPIDRDGVGLYPLARHNYLVSAMRRPEPSALGASFDAFLYGRQQREVSVRDVLDLGELDNVVFERTPCWLHLMLLNRYSESWFARLDDREVTARLQRHLLRQGLATLDKTRIRGRAVVQARIFDINLRLLSLTSRKRRDARRAAQLRAQNIGLAAKEVRDSERKIAPDSESGRVLAAATDWPAEEWMALSSARRQYLFNETMRLEGAAEKLQPVTVDVIDELIEARAGGELHSWLAHLGEAPAAHIIAWQGERGRRLLALDPETGFRGRAVIALHRGVDFLASGDQPTAIRSFALALSWAETDLAGEAVRNLSRRWLSYVAAQFRITDDLFVMLKTTVPRGDYSKVLEDQLWHAAFAADAESFQRCVTHKVGRGAVNQRIERLIPLSKGDAGAFLDGVRALIEATPSSAMRFIDRFLERLQSEDAPTRARLAPTLRAIADLLRPSDDDSRRGRRRADELLGQIDSILEGLPDATIDPERALTVERTVFAGSVRVAPNDTLPWPFKVAEVQPPSVFEPITLRPEEWRGEDGRWVLGWQILD